MREEETERIAGEKLAALSSIGAKAPVLTVLVGETAGTQFPLLKTTTVVGRGVECDLLLPDVGVSRRHAQFTRTNEGVQVEDLGSTNGVHVSGQRVQQAVLKDDDKIVMGPNAILLFHLTEPLEGEVQSRLYHGATRDAATGLYNGRIFQDFLEAEWPYSLRHNQQLSLLRVGIDHFSSLRDAQGSFVGETILKGFTETLQRVVRGEDLPARVGDGEFLVMLRRCDGEQACKLAERLRWAVDKLGYKAPAGGRERVTVSVGVASRNALADSSVESLLRASETALHQAMKGGGNRVQSA